MENLRNRSRLRQVQKILCQVNSYAEKVSRMEDNELSGKTAEFKERLSQGEGLDELLPEAYAVAREAAKRTLGMFPYDTQVMGGIVLHQGRIAEMKTGEGKTLVASMPLYLNALTGRSCILVTTNSYLAERDGKLLEKLFQFLNISLEIGVSDDPGVKLKTEDKKRIYQADIVYTTNAALGFDYLSENLAVSKEEQYLRDFYYVIIDEADSVLLDAAQTPLVISGVPRVQSNLYKTADYFVTLLKEGVDYILEDQTAWLTEQGIQRAERYFYIEDLFAEKNFEFVRHIYLALRAHTSFQKDRHYVVTGDTVTLLDEKTGRLLAATKLRAGQHQALEAKEHVTITQESRAMASVTYQNLFNMFEKKAGMTGTAKEDEEELKEIYDLEVVSIPTNRRMQRVDYADQYYGTLRGSITAAMEEILRVHETGQPILVIASSIAMNNVMSEMLLMEGIPHNVLNAYNTANEAEIIKEAGRRNAVTIATSVAGRGTDIRLGSGVEELGGLAVIGIGRMENRRQELQARGRSGRQGDPGFSKFYVSLEDDVVIHNGEDWLEKYRSGMEEIHNRKIIHAVNKAQKICEEQGAGARRSTMEFAESMRQQREWIYSIRQEILDGGYIPKDKLDKICLQVIDRFLREYKNENNGRLPSKSKVLRFAMDHLSYELKEIPKQEELDSEERIHDYLFGIMKSRIRQKLETITEEQLRQRFFRIMTLRAIDDAWVEEVDFLQQLRSTISGRRYTQRNVMYAFHEEAYESFERMQHQIQSDMIRNVCLGEIVRKENGLVQVIMP